MPLLNNKPFAKNPIPENLKLDDDVFYCQITDELFVDYEKFFERIILCNSLVWTCSMSGKSGLTFGEAVSAERFIESQIRPFVYALKRPLLYLVTLTHRKNINELVDELFAHIKGRFFVGETVEAYTDAGIKKNYKVLKIMWPNKNQDRKSLENGQVDSKCRSNSPSKNLSAKISPVKNSPAKNEVHKEPQAETFDEYEYAIQEISEQITSVRILMGSKLTRPRNIFTKERLRIFLKMNCEVDANEKIWKVKGVAITQYKLKSATYESISPGPVPVFGFSGAKKSHSEKDDDIIDLTDENGKSPKKNKKQTSDAQAKPSGNGENQKIKEAKIKARKDMQQVEEELKRIREQAAEKKKKKLEEKMENRKMEKAKKIEEKKKQKEDQMEWSKQREDLECEDLKDLPVATPISCPGLSEERFGDLVLVTEFITAFHSILNLHLPKNFTLVKLNEALNEKVVDGTYGDLLVSIMSSLFSFGKESVDTEDSEELSDCNKTYKQALATYGTTLNDLQLDVYTVSEIVRIYLTALPLSQFNNNGSSNDRSSFVDELAERNIYDMKADDKLQVLYILVHQLLMCDVVRTQIEETLENLKVAQRNLKSHQLSCAKRERDELQFWSKKKQEQRFKCLLTGEPVPNSDDKASSVLEPELEISGKVSTRANNQSIPDEKFENLPTENFDWSKISAYEKQQMKLWESKTEKSLMQQISKFQVGCPVALGFDRTHRRYWKLTCLPGIFVEDYEDEISGFTVPSPVKQRVLSPSKNKKKESVKLQEGEKSDKENVPFHSQTDLSSPSKCPTMTVHEQLTKKGQTRWSYYNKVEQIDVLMTSLNVRGLRESHLLTTIKEYYQGIVSGLTEPEKDLLSALVAQSCSDSRDHSNEMEVDEDAGVEDSGETELEAGLTESILDLEERIFVGALGKLKNVDREKWRGDIENGRYDDILKILPVSSDLPSSSVKRSKRYDGLVSALLQIEKMVERRFINFETEVDKKSKKHSKKKDNGAVESDDDSSTSSHNGKMWEANIQTITSLSQLFLFMSIIDSSVMWTKSALNARCCICRRKGDGENMLLCDKCDKGHHTYCLKPPVKNIPEGDWFCPKCRPKNQTKRVAKEKLKIEESVDENNSETKDYEQDQMISDDDEVSGSDGDDSDYEKPMAKQEIVNKRFYSKKKSGKVASTSSLSSLAQSNVSLQKYSSSNTRRNTRNSNQSNKRRFDDDDDAGDAKSSRGKRERGSFADLPVKKRGAYSMGSKDVNLSQIPMKSCENLITELMNNENSWPFLRPVSKKEVPDYFDVVKNPMDFSRIRNKIHSFEYKTTEDIVGDVRLIFSNCKLYNQPSSCFYEAADKLSEVFEDELNKLSTTSSHSSFRGRHSKESYVQEGGSRKRKRIQESESEDEPPSRTLRKRN